MKRKTKDRKAYFNALNSVKNRGSFLFHAWIDFATFKISTVQPLVYTLNGLVNNSDTFVLEHGFKIRFFGLVAGSQLKVLHVNDSKDNLIAYIHLKQQTQNTNKNFSDDIEFVGLFWTCYSEYLEYFFELFGIDPNKKHIVTRIDYCIDIAGLDVSELIKYQKTSKRKKDHCIRYGKKETYSNIKNDRHDLVIYNKKLDIVEKWKTKIVLPDGMENPFLKYQKESSPITRIEYRKRARALRELHDNSWNALNENIRNLSMTYFHTFYNFDLGILLKKGNSGSKRQKDILVDKIITKKSSFYWSMAIAYLSNFENMKGRIEIFKRLYELYGETLFSALIKIRDNLPVDEAFNTAIFHQEVTQKNLTK